MTRSRKDTKIKIGTRSNANEITSHAEALTAITAEQFAKVKIDILSDAKNADAISESGYKALQKLGTTQTFIVVDELANVANLNELRNVTDKWLQVAGRLFQEGNYFSAQAIFYAFTQLAITKLQDNHKFMSSNAKRIYDHLMYKFEVEKKVIRDFENDENLKFGTLNVLTGKILNADGSLFSIEDENDKKEFIKAFERDIKRSFAAMNKGNLTPITLSNEAALLRDQLLNNGMVAQFSDNLGVNKKATEEIEIQWANKIKALGTTKANFKKPPRLRSKSAEAVIRKTGKGFKKAFITGDRVQAMRKRMRDASTEAFNVLKKATTKTARKKGVVIGANRPAAAAAAISIDMKPESLDLEQLFRETMQEIEFAPTPSSTLGQAGASLSAIVESEASISEKEIRERLPVEDHYQDNLHDKVAQNNETKANYSATEFSSSIISKEKIDNIAPSSQPPKLSSADQVASQELKISTISNIKEPSADNLYNKIEQLYKMIFLAKNEYANIKSSSSLISHHKDFDNHFHEIKKIYDKANQPSKRGQKEELKLCLRDMLNEIIIAYETQEKNFSKPFFKFGKKKTALEFVQHLNKQSNNFHYPHMLGMIIKQFLDFKLTILSDKTRDALEKLSPSHHSHIKIITPSTESLSTANIKPQVNAELDLLIKTMQKEKLGTKDILFELSQIKTHDYDTYQLDSDTQGFKTKITEKMFTAAHKALNAANLGDQFLKPSHTMQLKK